MEEEDETTLEPLSLIPATDPICAMTEDRSAEDGLLSPPSLAGEAISIDLEAKGSGGDIIADVDADVDFDINPSSSP